MSQKDEWFYINNADEVDSPVLLIYTDRVKKNIQTAIDVVEGKADRLRPHVKTHKSKDAATLLLEAGITKFKCATIAEAEMLGSVNAPDVLLSYQPFGPKLKRFIDLIKTFPATNFSCLIDNIDTAKSIAAIASVNNLEVPVYLDLNVGMDRTGIVPGNNAIQLYVEASSVKGIKPVGFQVYDGHIRSLELEERTRQSDEAFAKVEEMKAQLMAQGFEPTIIAGGSPTFPVHAKRKDVECSPGTFIYWDWWYTMYKEQDFVPAALVLCRVISLPGTNKLCIDLGHKSIASENALHNRVHFLNAPELRYVSHSEEHLVAEASEGHPYKVGDILYGVPYHICPTVALYGTALTIENKEVTGEWKIVARERKITV